MRLIIKTWMLLAVLLLTVVVDCRPMESISDFVIPSRHSLSGLLLPTKSSYSVEIIRDNIVPTYTDHPFPMLHGNSIADVPVREPVTFPVEVQNGHARRLKLKIAIDNARNQIQASNQDF